MKYLNYLFAQAQEIASHPYLCYSNCDIVLTSRFREGFEKTLNWKRSFLLVGQRWDTDISWPLDFENASWETELGTLATSQGMRQAYDFVDFFAFPKGMYDCVPPFLLGRSYWDHWLVWKALSKGAVVDGTLFFTAVHQNHDYGYHPQGKKGTNEDALAMRNKALAGSGTEQKSLIHATHRLTYDGKIRPVLFRRVLHDPRVRSKWQFAVERTFETRKRLGLRRQNIRKLFAKSRHTDATNAS